MDLPHQTQDLPTFAGRRNKKSSIGGHGLAVVGIGKTQIEIEVSGPIDGCSSS
jgi:hypothetical protein